MLTFSGAASAVAAACMVNCLARVSSGTGAKEGAAELEEVAVVASAAEV